MNCEKCGSPIDNRVGELRIDPDQKLCTSCGLREAMQDAELSQELIEQATGPEPKPRDESS